MNLSKNIRLTIVLLALVIAVVAFIKLPLNLGLDLQGGTQLILEAQDTPEIKVTNDAILGAMEVIRNRIDGLGISEPIIQRKGMNQIVVELPGIHDPQRAITLIGETALLEFVEAEWAPENIESLTPEKLELLAGKNARIGKIVHSNAGGKAGVETPIILKNTALTGKDLQMASPGTDQYGKPVVNIEFTKEGAQKFYEVTKRCSGKPLAILLDNKVISAPRVNEAIPSGRAQISGNFSIGEMRDLVIKLKAGALPVPIKIIYNKTVGPTLGKDSIEKSKLAGMIGFALVVGFMILIYRIPGVLASIALSFYVLIVMALFKMLGATMTLPGIAGVILTIGMAVDANVIIFERIKDEREDGKEIVPAIEAGFGRAFITILDSNITTLISAVLLFWLGTGTIKGFSVTLSIGVLVSMFTAIFVTRLLLEGFVSFYDNKEKLLVRK